MKEEFKIVSRYDSDNILYKSSDYEDFKGSSWNDFVLFCLNKNFSLSNANLYNANLYNANLYNANLKNANLYNANLEYANLEYANLENANLYNANLYNANLEYANLEYANLENANLENANLKNANLENANLEYANLPIFSKWAITYYKNDENKIIVKIGCKEKNIKEWDLFFSDKCTEKFDTERNTIEFLRIKTEYKAVRAYIKTLGKNLYNFNKNEVV